MTLSITLDSHQIEPGGTISGIARWQADHASLVVELRWETRGKGDKDVQVVATTKLPVAGRTEMPFSLTAPYTPFSFSGALISVMYKLRATLGAETDEREIVIAPGGKEVELARP